LYIGDYYLKHHYNLKWRIAMETNDERIYMPIGAARLIDIKVMLDNEQVYDGMVEDAPGEIKKLKYSKVEMGNKITYYVHSELQ